jgi:putative transcriptional regulator
MIEADLKSRIASEIVFSQEPGKVLKKWRKIFCITQREMSDFLNTTPSFVSDYESGKRKSPGVYTVRKIIDALFEIDRLKGCRTIRKYVQPDELMDLIRIQEFSDGIRADAFINLINGTVHTQKIAEMRMIYGYTIIDSLKAIVTLSPEQFVKTYGRTSERALMFTGVKYGRSPMVVVRTQQLKPAMVVYIKPERVDALAVKLAEIDRVILVTTNLELSELESNLKSIERRGV